MGGLRTCEEHVAAVYDSEAGIEGRESKGGKDERRGGGERVGVG